MKKTLLIFACALVFSSPVLAQRDPPKAVDDYFPDKWQTYEFKDDKFTIRLPGKPKETPATRTDGGTVFKDNSIEYRGVVSFLIISAEYPIDFEKLGKAQDALEAGKQNGLLQIKDLEPRIVKEENFTFEGHPAKSIQMETNAGEVLRTKIIIVNAHAYILVASSRKAAKGVMGSENDYEKIAIAFLDSFHLIS